MPNKEKNQTKKTTGRKPRPESKPISETLGAPLPRRAEPQKTPSALKLLLEFIETAPIDEDERLRRKDNILIGQIQALDLAIRAARARGRWIQQDLFAAFDATAGALETVEAILAEIKQKL